MKATASHIEERITAARAKAEESLKAAKAAEDYVRDNPCKAVGITAAVGFVLGILVARR